MFLQFSKWAEQENITLHVPVGGLIIDLISNYTINRQMELGISAAQGGVLWNP